jgi:hypothetical protein
MPNGCIVYSLSLIVSKGKLTVEFYNKKFSLEEFDNSTAQQVTSIRNEVLPVPDTDNNASKEPSLRNGHSLEGKRTPEGNNLIFVLRFVVNVFKTNFIDVSIPCHFTNRGYNARRH